MRLAALLANVLLMIGIALSPQVSAQHASPTQATASAAGSYVPGLGEIMAAQQMRHAKLWLAGRARNWPLASYELDELREGFEDAAKFQPVHDDVPVAAMIAKLTPEPLEALSKAVAAKNAAQFARSFDQLTAACNECHRAANHGFIVIVRPTSSAFPNQAFAPSK
jgi:hypothetical protein